MAGGNDSTRREFLTNAAFTAAVAAAAPAVAAAGQPQGPASTGGASVLGLDRVTVASFTPHLGSRFRLGEAALELIEAQPLGGRLPTGGGPGRSEPFSLVFRGPGTPVFPQHTHRLEHAVLGELEVFLVPIGPDDRGMRYQAVFN